MRFGLQTKPLTKEMKTKNAENKQTKNLQNKQKKSSSDKFFFFQTQENVLRKGLVNSLNYGTSKNCPKIQFLIDSSKLFKTANHFRKERN